MTSTFNITPPTAEALREASLAWLSRIQPTLIDQWPEEVAALSVPTTFVRFPIDQAEALFEPLGWPAGPLQDLAEELDEAMAWQRHFIRLNSRSPKDAPWPFEVPATCSGREALTMLASSERILDDLCLFRHVPEQPAVICLREFIHDVRPSSEFRCFVRDRQLIAVSHYDYRNPQRPPEDGGAGLRAAIDAWFADKLQPRLHIDTVVFDIQIGPQGVLLIELNPYGLSDPCCLGDYKGVENFSGHVAFAGPTERAA